jgi:glycerol transport system permease protein
MPEAQRQAARIGGAGRWAVFRHVRLPRQRQVLPIAVPLRAMDGSTHHSGVYVVTRGGAR